MAGVGGRGLSWRRLRSLVGHLPADSATALSMYGDKVLWGATEHLLAIAIDALQWANYQRADPKKANRPEPLPRPGVTAAGDQRRSRLTPAQMHARLRNQQQRRAQRR